MSAMRLLPAKLGSSSQSVSLDEWLGELDISIQNPEWSAAAEYT